MSANTGNDRRARHRIGAVVVAFALGAVAVVLLARFDVFGGSSASDAAAKQDVAVAQAREVPSFRSVDLAGSNNVSIDVGKRQSVVVNGDRGAVRHVTTVVVGGKLVIGNTPDQPSSKSPMRVVITMPALTALELGGSGVLSATNLIGAPLSVALSGSGIVRASGSATDVGIRLGGSGDIQLEHLVARNVAATLAGSGRILVNAANSLKASVPGSGVIMYVGQPEHVTTAITGSGAVIPLDV
jgi:hypothetical protein